VYSGPLKGTAFGPGGVPYQFHYGDVVSYPSMHGGDWRASTVLDRMDSLDPIQSRKNLFARFAYDVSDNVNVFVQLAWGNGHVISEAFSQFQPSSAAGVKTGNPFIPASVQARMTALGVTQLPIGSYNYDLPDTYADTNRMVNRNVVGAAGKLD